MSLATRCPWCETVFRMSKEQAAQRSGMVRCGVCNQSFNALDYLVRPSDLSALDESLATLGSEFKRPGSAGAALAQGAAHKASEALRPVKPRLEQASLEDITVDTSPGPRMDPDDDEMPLGGIGSGRPGFFGPAEEEVRAVRRGRLVWGALSLFALIVLAFQAIYIWRSDIAAAYPESRGLLKNACLALGCKIDPPIDLQALAIETSTLEPLPGSKDAMTFTAVLHNSAPIPVRLPAIELTLTDADNHATVRRVLSPQEYLMPADKALTKSLGSALPAGSETPVKIVFEAKGVPVVGYQANLFYP